MSEVSSMRKFALFIVMLAMTLPISLSGCGVSGRGEGRNDGPDPAETATDASSDLPTAGN